MLIDAILSLTAESPYLSIFLLSLFTFLMLRALFRLNQRLQQSYDKKAD